VASAAFAGKDIVLQPGIVLQCFSLRGRSLWCEEYLRRLAKQSE
jgi:hypothetical protein